MPPTLSHNQPRMNEFNVHNTDITFTETISAEEYRKNMHVAETPQDEASWFQQVWLGDGSPPFVIDPIGQDAWSIGNQRHAQSRARGLSYDRQAVEDLLGKEGLTENPVVPFFEPTLADFNVNKLFSPPLGSGCISYRGVPRNPKNYGRLPVITRLKYDGNLADKSTDDLDAELLQHMKTQGARIWNRDGKLSQLR